MSFKKFFYEDSKLVNRESVGRFLMTQGLALEISPFTAPFLKGDSVRYFELMSREKIIELANINKLPTEDIPEEIHYISKDGDLSQIKDKFNIIFSSHVIEHIPNLVKHINDVEKILMTEGMYALYIPDYRYCFDHFREPSSIFDVIEAFYENRNKHTLKNILLSNNLGTHNDPIKHWCGFHGKKCSPNINTIHRIIQEEGVKKERFVDCHAWRLTPQIFVEIFKTLLSLKLISLHISYIQETMPGSFEFLVILTKKKYCDEIQFDTRGYYRHYFPLFKSFVYRVLDKISKKGDVSASA